MVECTVLIPCHNQGDTLAQAVESVLEASQVIVVSDAQSRDYTDTGIYKHKNVYHVSTFSLVASGVCHARNLGISYASNDVIVPLDADDYFIPGGLRDLVEAYQPNTFVYPGWIEHESGLEFFPPPPGKLKDKHIGHATMVFHRDDWKRVGGYRPEFNVGAEDWMFALHLESIGVKPVALQKLCYTYRKSNSGRAAATYRRANIVRQLMKEFLNERVLQEQSNAIPESR